MRFVADNKVDDGRYANNGWLQECPDPMTKLVWDNAMLISPRLAKELGSSRRPPLLQVARDETESSPRARRAPPWPKSPSAAGRSAAPLHIQPGLDNYTLILPLGYGRTAAGRVGTGTGFDAYRLRTRARRIWRRGDPRS